MAQARSRTWLRPVEVWGDCWYAVEKSVNESGSRGFVNLEFTKAAVCAPEVDPAVNARDLGWGTEGGLPEQSLE